MTTTTQMPAGTVECDGTCKGGMWYGRGYFENGIWRGQSGKCFRCGGKGHQTPQDVRRNRYYDNHVRRV